MAAAYEELYGLVRRAGILGTVGELLDWDQEVMMPPGAAALRAQQVGVVSAVAHDLLVDPRVGELLATIDEDSLEAEAAALVREVRRRYERARRVPSALVEELASVSAEAVEAWKDARARDDFASFAPWLSRIVSLKRAYAAAVDPDAPAYEVLLQDFEPDLSLAETRAFLSSLREGLVPLLEGAARISEAPFLSRPVPEEEQRRFIRGLLSSLGYDFGKGRFDVSAHPFTAAFGRITTRFSDSWQHALLSSVHEAGHAAYEHGLPVGHVGTPLGEACSFGVHESQSRFWENLVARARPFWERWFPSLQEAYRPVLDGVSLDDFLSSWNRVAPGLIRVDADELTYCLHVIVRFELEESLIEGSLSVEDVPAAWREKMRAYLGVEVPDDASGCLQDVHWASGLFGYFPSYAVGSALAYQLRRAMGRELDVDGLLRAGEYGPILEWLRRHVHAHGRRYPLQELVRRATGEEFSAEAFLAGLRERYCS